MRHGADAEVTADPGLAADPGAADDVLEGPLHVEAAGVPGAPPMVFVHPNPMDSTAWMFQMAHLSTWYRCLAVDLPGYGRSPAARGPLTMASVAAAVWEAVDAEVDGPAVVVGCSVGAVIAQYLYHQRPDDVAAVVLTGAGWSPTKPHLQRHVDAYRRQGLAYRYEYALADFSASFRTTPLARWLADVLVERNHLADLATILAMFAGMQEPDPDWLSRELHAPTLILSGTEDNAHARAHALHARLPDSELVALEGAGHACNLEVPAVFDEHLLTFLARRGLR